MAAVCAEAEVPRLHRRGAARCDRFLAQREVAGALDQVLQEKVERALLGLTKAELRAIELEPTLFADVVVARARVRRVAFRRHANLPSFMSLPPPQMYGISPILPNLLEFRLNQH